jgi:hypothetical protein
LLIVLLLELLLLELLLGRALEALFFEALEPEPDLVGMELSFRRRKQFRLRTVPLSASRRKGDVPLLFCANKWDTRL